MGLLPKGADSFILAGFAAYAGAGGPGTCTDILWTSNSGVRRWAKGDVGKVYYSTLVVFVIWGGIAINLAQPFILILLGAFVAGLMMAICGVQVWSVNRTFLPREVQARSGARPRCRSSAFSPGSSPSW
jgi:hypothetical protein